VAELLYELTILLRSRGKLATSLFEQTGFYSELLSTALPIAQPAFARTPGVL
jgi:hypothetical protein